MSAVRAPRLGDPLPAPAPASARGHGRLLSLVSTYAGRIWAISVAGLVGRLLFLDHQPLWRDEAFTAVVVQRPVGQMLDAVRADSAPPLAYLLDHAVAAVSSGPAAVRLVAAVAGAGAIPLGAALGRRIASTRAGVLTALLCAVTPALVLSARDARMYSLATTLVMASTLLLWRALERPTVVRWTLYAGATTLALYTHYFVVFAVLAQLVSLLVLRARWRTVAAAALAAGVAALTLLPWLVAARAQFAHAGQPFWVQRFGFLPAVGVFLGFYSGPPIDPDTPDKVLLLTTQGFCAGAGVLVASAAAVFLWRRVPASGRRGGRFVLACSLVAIALVVAAAAVRPVFDARYVSVVWGPLFAVVGAGLALIPWRALAAACLVAIAAPSIAVSAVVSHPDTPAAVAMLRSHVRAQDVVDASPSVVLLLDYYGDAQLQARTRVVQGSVDWFWGTAAFAPGTVVPAVPGEAAARGGVVYFVGEPADRAGLGAGWTARSRQCWTGVCVTTYSR